MKLKYFLLLGVLIALQSCSHNRPGEPTARIMGTSAADVTATHTVAQLKALYTGQPTIIADNVIVEAVISSDDTEGNLYRNAYIQDNTGGIELKLSLGNLSAIYPQGAKVILRAQGMTLGAYGEQINLGYRSLDSRYETSYYPEKLISNVLHKVSLGNVEPKELTIATLSKEYAGKLIRLNEVQFLSSELGQTYAAPDNRSTQANVNRTLQDRGGSTLVVRTSSYAKFAGSKLPEGSGSIIGVLTYFRSTPQLLLLRERDANMSGARF